MAASNRPLLIDRVFHPRFPANNPSAVRCCGVDEEEEEGEVLFRRVGLAILFSFTDVQEGKKSQEEDGICW